ncbi:[FeFe] hydrogenase H-cluster radical SAM maturase HydE [Xianfuyuplasma coldseepsis]|uniref:[FeFe] hydrogenase H-cluster radical SAM maturase HydE n=1 Tax=Candidatus Xianfuyuplasma coldseepsis TaxID=2782163 RepID=UPI002163170D
MITLIDKLKEVRRLEREEYLYILNNTSQKELEYLRKSADSIRLENYGTSVYMRGLIEFSNFCTRSCNYCGIRRQNQNIDRYRLDKDTILSCCEEGYNLGYRTFVLQSGEDKYFSDDIICDIVNSIKKKFPDTAVTLSIGEKSKESYQRYFDSGADRYLLRHETASRKLYEHLHPNDMSFDTRMQCLQDLKEIGYQVGCGFMVNSPTQTNEDLVEDLLFIEKLQPHMVGIGPYLSHSETPFSGLESGNLLQTITMVSLVRLILPDVLLPSTTALGTLNSKGREEALKSGANVVMPNLSPTEHREKYEIYENKICTGDEAAHCRGCIETRIIFAGYEVDMSVGHHKTRGINNGMVRS